MSAAALFAGFARVGLLAFGGGPAMIPLMQAECVGRGWVTEEQFLEGLALASSLPGPLSTKMAVYVGWQRAGALGATSALLGVLAPSTAMILALTPLVLRYREHPAWVGAMRAARPAVVGMLAWVAWDLAPGGIHGAAGAAVAAAAFVALVAEVHPGVVLLCAMGLGAVALRG